MRITADDGDNLRNWGTKIEMRICRQRRRCFGLLVVENSQGQCLPLTANIVRDDFAHSSQCPIALRILVENKASSLSLLQLEMEMLTQLKVQAASANASLLPARGLIPPLLSHFRSGNWVHS